MRDDERFMRLALAAARRVRFTHPNPKVGALLVAGGRPVASASHGGAGRPHAEAQVVSHAEARGATLYVTLEPCVHHGRTPPCAPAIADAGIARVVVAMEDPDERVAGRGIAHLRAAGIAVTEGVLGQRARNLNEAYVHHRTTGRPLLWLKLALSIDGRVAAADSSARWITSPRTRLLVHERRLECDAVMVGAGTVLTDDPRLTVRDVAATRQPLRVVVDGRGRVPPDASALAGGPGSALVATTHHAPHETQLAWKEVGAEVAVLASTSQGVDLSALLDALGRRGIVSLLCEGGPRLATSLLAEDLVDVLEIHAGGVLIGAPGPALGDVGVATIEDASRWAVVRSTLLDDDVLTVYRRRRS